MTPLSKAADDYRHTQDRATDWAFVLSITAALAALLVIAIAGDPLVRLILDR